MAKFINLENLGSFLTKLKDLFVAKEHKTGSATDWKVLSDNNLTDDLVTKINTAAAKTGSVTRFTAADTNLDSGAKGIDPNTLNPAGGQVGDLIYDGHHDAYTITAVAEDGTLTISNAIGKGGAWEWADVNNQPQVNGHALAAGDNTLDALGIEAAGAAAAARTGAVDDVKKLGYQTADNVNTTVDAAKTDLQKQITAAVTSVYNAKGSTAFDDLPAVADAKKGDVYNITDAFATTDDFVEGAGKNLPAGTNIMCIEVTIGEGENATTAHKWDAAAGMTDLSGYYQKTDLVAATNDEIDALFA